MLFLGQKHGAWTDPRQSHRQPRIDAGVFASAAGGLEDHNTSSRYSHELPLLERKEVCREWRVEVDSPNSTSRWSTSSADAAGMKACSSTSAIRTLALPSHNSGTRTLAGRTSYRISRTPVRILSESVPTNRLVPDSIVTGRSVFSRKVKQGTPRTVVSS